MSPSSDGDCLQITDEILPMLVADPNNLQNLPEIVMKLKQGLCVFPLMMCACLL